MKVPRSVIMVSKSRPVVEGAGVHLRRAIGLGDPAQFDPFLLLDDFRSNEPAKYLKGFPWHPHRGIETITYVLTGSVSHKDSTGRSGTIASGDVQWMTAGGGIYHQEMPQGDEAGVLEGFQLWANLPASHKMMEPRYRGITASEIPVVSSENGATVRVIAGSYAGTEGPVRDVIIAPCYLDVTLSPGATFEEPIAPEARAFAYVIGGSISFGSTTGDYLSNRSLALFGDGDGVSARAGEGGGRFLLVSGTPLKEPIAWYGPIVMNTEEELRKAYRELEDGTFIR